MKIAHQKLEAFSERILCAAGADPSEAAVVCQVLNWCDLAGRLTQGVWRLPIFTRRLHSGAISSPCHPEFHQLKPSVCLLDGKDGMGHYIGHIGMLKACEMASEHGVGIVGVKNSNFYGAGGYYVKLAADRGMIGFAFSNSFPKVAAYGGGRSVFGTNPMAFGSPLRGERSILLDFSTSASSGSMIRKYIEEGKPLPEGIAVSDDGQPITDPQQVSSGSLLPFGGPKGYGLALMVEILAGVLTGGGYSHQVESMYHNLDKGGNNGHCFIAIDVTSFMPLEGYFDRIHDLLQMVRSSGKEGSVRIPGETRWEVYERQIAEGVEIDAPTKDALLQLAAKLNVDWPF